jgi:hypothetical protein
MTHPITPPPELMRHWARFQGDTDAEALWFRIATEAAQWGADQELEACCEWLAIHFAGVEKILRAARRPKPPSLKQQALEALVRCAEDLDNEGDWDLIERALEALPE